MACADMIRILPLYSPKQGPRLDEPGSLFWRRVQDSNPRGHHCPNGFQDRPVMTASVTLRVFDVVFAGWFLKMAAGKWRENRREIS